MSELQFAIAGLGVIGVAAVVAYNAWVARRHRRIGEAVLPKVVADPLLDREVPAASADEIRVNWSESSHERGIESIGGASAPAERQEPEVEPAPDRHLLSPDFDFQIVLRTLDPVAGDRLVLLAGELARKHAHRIAVLGFSDSGVWERPDAQRAYTNVRTGLQLADRRGPADAGEIGAFKAAVQQFADEVMAVVEAGEINDAADRAQSVDGLCARVDTQVGINVIGRNMAFSPTRLRTLIERCGAEFAADGSAVIADEAGNPQYVILDHDGQSLAPNLLAGATVRGLTFLLDVPRVAGGDAVFARMVQAAKDFAGTLGGELVDDQRLPLTDAALDAIRKQIGQQQALMESSGIAPGSALARRLFA